VITEDLLENSPSKRDLVLDKNVYPELAMLSTPPGVNSDSSDYVYDDVAGEGITIYVIDTSFNLEHIVCILLLS